MAGSVDAHKVFIHPRKTYLSVPCSISETKQKRQVLTRLNTSVSYVQRLARHPIVNYVKLSNTNVRFNT